MTVSDNCLNRIIVILLQAKQKLATSTSGCLNELRPFRSAYFPSFSLFKNMTFIICLVEQQSIVVVVTINAHFRTIKQVGAQHWERVSGARSQDCQNTNKFPEARKTTAVKQWNNMSLCIFETETNLNITSNLPCITSEHGQLIPYTSNKNAMTVILFDVDVSQR